MWSDGWVKFVNQPEARQAHSGRRNDFDTSVNNQTTLPECPMFASAYVG
jgi:hypothetical protein